MRTITQRTTLPFLIAESGAASFTLAVTTSPKPARRPRSPPRGRMQESLRAPLLSATSRMVRIPIIKAPVLSSQNPRVPAFFRLLLLNLHVQFRWLRAHLRCAANHIGQLPVLQLAQ